MYTKGKDVPLDHPLATLPELVMCQALIHHKNAFPAPGSWFPGVPTTLDGGVRLRPTHAHKIGKGRAMLFCKLDDGFSCNSSIIATADAAFNSFQFEARGPIASGEQRSIVDALYAWKPGQSTLQQLGVKACGYTLAPKKATNLLALHTTLGAQFGTKFFAATALTTLPDPDTSNHSLQCDMFEPDPKHRGAMLRTELAPALNGLRASMLKWMACGGGARWRKCCVALSMRLHASLVHVFTTRSNATSTCL